MANAAATALTSNAAISNFMAIAAGAAFDTRPPLSRCNRGPRSQLAQIANETTIRSAEAKARMRATSDIGVHLVGAGAVARVDRGRQHISQIDCLGLS